MQQRCSQYIKRWSACMLWQFWKEQVLFPTTGLTQQITGFLNIPVSKDVCKTEWNKMRISINSWPWREQLPRSQDILCDASPWTSKSGEKTFSWSIVSAISTSGWAVWPRAPTVPSWQVWNENKQRTCTVIRNETQMVQIPWCWLTSCCFFPCRCFHAWRIWILTGQCSTTAHSTYTDLWFAISVYQQPQAQSPFLFPTVYGVNLSPFYNGKKNHDVQTYIWSFLFGSLITCRAIWERRNKELECEYFGNGHRMSELIATMVTIWERRNKECKFWARAPMVTI